MEIGFLTSNAPESVCTIASNLGLALWSDWPESATGALRWIKDRLELVMQDQVCTHVDFVCGAARHRRQFGGGCQQMIARAVGNKRSSPASVLDATAGQGYDAFLLASLGCPVTLLERSPVAFLLLQDGLARAAAHVETRDIVARMKLIYVDAHHWLSQQRAYNTYTESISCSSEYFTQEATYPALQSPDVVYLDPMFNQLGSRAKSKKAMASFQHILGGDLDADELLSSARYVAKKRVVVKRARYAPWLAGARPDFAYFGQSTRFDAYRPLYPSDEEASF